MYTAWKLNCLKTKLVQLQLVKTKLHANCLKTKLTHVWLGKVPIFSSYLQFFLRGQQKIEWSQDIILYGFFLDRWLPLNHLQLIVIILSEDQMECVTNILSDINIVVHCVHLHYSLKMKSSQSVHKCYFLNIFFKFSSFTKIYFRYLLYERHYLLNLGIQQQ